MARFDCGGNADHCQEQGRHLCLRRNRGWRGGEGQRGGEMRCGGGPSPDLFRELTDDVLVAIQFSHA